MSNILDLEERSIELELKEVQLERKLNDLRLKRLKEESKVKVVPVSSVPEHPLFQLHYSKSAKDNLMRIATVERDGSIGIFGKKDSVLYSKQYTVQSLKWICKKLPVWSKKQKVEKNFFENIAKDYSRKFAKVSDTTMEKLCYIVDSGSFDVWFEKYSNMKSKQVRLME